MITRTSISSSRDGPRTRLSLYLDSTGIWSIAPRRPERWELTSIRSNRVNDRTNINVLLEAKIPSKSVSHFVRRGDIGEEIGMLPMNEYQRTAVLLGIGSSGKTQLALECCRRAEADLNFAAVIWIDASSPATVGQSYSAIALKVTGGIAGYCRR